MVYSAPHTSAFVATNRLGLGARAGDIAALKADPKAAVLSQIGADLRGDHAWRNFDRAAARDAATMRAKTTGLQGDARQEAREAAQAAGRRIYQAGTTALLRSRLTTDLGFAERWGAFLSNHLCISSTAGPPIRPWLPLYEVEVIRPNAFGRFADLVFASATHGGMLIYLDQARSIGPNSPVGTRRGNAGLNENYARELLELHTLGVDGGYEISDIRDLAKILSGWSLVTAALPPRMTRGVNANPGDAAFIPAFHEPGRKRVMGKTYGEGVAATNAVIEDLCARPQTARFLATKILLHFMGSAADSHVDTLARAYMASDGDLAAVARALLNLDQLWRGEGQIFRSPQDYLVALLRAVGPDNMGRDALRASRQFLTDSRQLPWGASSPQGYLEGLNTWADPNAIKARTDYAQLISIDLAENARNIDASDLGTQVLDLTVAPNLASALGNAPDRQTALTLLFASPQFMWR